MKKIFLLSLFLVSGLSHAALETTQDYAYGAELNISNSDSMFSRVDLNRDVYTETVSSNLNDVRVFNQNGQPVPFALVNVYEQNNTSQTFPMTIYSLDESHRNNQNSNDGAYDKYQINISGKDLNINVDKPNSSDKYSTTYLLQVPDNVKLEQAINRLVIDFDEAESSQNWQATANLRYSYNLQYWQSAINDIPIMALVDNNNNQSLKLNTIDISSNSNHTARNWLITFQSQQPIPKVKNISVSTKNKSEKIAMYPIDLSIKSSDKQEAIYQLPSLQPVKELSIELSNPRTVLPLSIYYKTNDDDKEWRKLGDYMIRRLDYYDEPQRIALNSKLNIKQLQIKAINASFENAPKILAYRDRMNIVFNSANNGPFILAWGSVKATAASLAQQDLLSSSDSVINLPEAYIGDPVKLAGERALTATSESAPSGFPRWIIWLCLVGGAAFLVVLALKLIKEIKKTQ